MDNQRHTLFKKKQSIFLSIFFIILLPGCRSALTPTLLPDTSSPPPATAPPAPTAKPTITRQWRVTGLDVPALSGFDSILLSYMQIRDISQGALAVTYQGRLILAHGYTWAAGEDAVTQPTSLFRIASVSKPVTAVAILKLVQDGRLSLDTKIVDLLDLTPPAGQTLDPRLADVTVAHLLAHRGGWAFEPMFSDIKISRQLGAPLPISQANIIQYMSGIPLTYLPGTRYIYSNYGYLLLGRIIEAVSRQPYQVYVKQNVLEPIGITHMQLGHTLPAQQLPGEVAYHSDFTGPTVFDASGAAVSLPYGAWNLENMDSHGGWVASAVDLARFEASFDDPASHPVLTQASIDRMFAPQPGETAALYYALGWFVDRVGSHPDGRLALWQVGRDARLYGASLRRRRLGGAFQPERQRPGAQRQQLWGNIPLASPGR